MEFNIDSKYLPRHDVVFSIVFSKASLFTALVRAVTGDAFEIDGDPHSQAMRRGDDAMLNSIRFDMMGKSLDDRLYTVDIQRKYSYDRQVRRSVYYAAVAVASQQVKKMRYDLLMPVVISFLFTDIVKKKSGPVREVKLLYTDTHDVFDDLLRILVVHVPAVARKGGKGDLCLISRFLRASDQESARLFVKDYGEDPLGKELEEMYNKSVANKQNLEKVEGTPYYTGRLSEAELEEARAEARAEARTEGLKEGREEGLKEGREETQKEDRELALKEKREAAVVMLTEGLGHELIAKALKFSLDEIAQIAEGMGEKPQ
jgi:predicted transposase/invertase (TIGR01784 family)